jgi:putative oxidoreductase
MLSTLRTRWNQFFSPENQAFLSDLGLLTLRLSFGLMMLFGHGLVKAGKFSVLATQFPDPLGIGHLPSLFLAVFAEVGCSILLILGLGTRFAALNLVITMLVAVVLVHGGDPFDKKEMALLYLFPYITLLLSGAGRFSVDRLIGKALDKSAQET